MIRGTTLFVVLLAGLVLTCSSAWGAEGTLAKIKNLSYIKISGLIVSEDLDTQQTKNKFSNPSAVTVAFDDSWGLQVAGGYVYNKYFTAEAMLEAISPFEASGALGKDEFEVANLGVNGKFTCPYFKDRGQQNISPYALLGVSAMNAREDITSGGVNWETSDRGLGYRLGLGVDLMTKSNYSLVLEGALVKGTGSVDHVEYSYFSMGVAYHF